MTHHSANELNPYIGTTLVGGILCHRWFDGRTLPVLRGAAESDDGDGDGDDGEDGDGDPDDDDDSADDGDDGDDEDDPKKKAKDGGRANREAAKYRVRAKERTAERDAAITRATTAEAELAKLKKDGVTDEATKARLTALETENAQLKSQVEKHDEERRTIALEATVQEALDDLKIDCEADIAISRLRKNGHVPDEDGDIEDLDTVLKALVKKGVFKKIASGDDDKETKDEPGARRSGGPSTTRSGKPKTGLDQASLAKKFPALRGR